MLYSEPQRAHHPIEHDSSRGLRLRPLLNMKTTVSHSMVIVVGEGGRGSARSKMWRSPDLDCSLVLGRANIPLHNPSKPSRVSY